MLDQPGGRAPPRPTGSGSSPPSSPTTSWTGPWPPWLPTLASKPPGAMRLGRESFYAVWDSDAADTLAYLHAMLTITSQTAEAAEGIAAFAAKRPPAWQVPPTRPDPTEPEEQMTMAKRALITGVTGQDGSYLAELLLDQGYEVIGMVRRSSTVNFERIAHIEDRLTLVAGDLFDEVSMIDILRDHRPAEVYNLAAQSFVQTSWSQPVLTGETTALGVTRVLDAIRTVDPEIRFYQASSSEMFGKVHEVPQTRDARPSIHAALTAWPRCTGTGSP